MVCFIWLKLPFGQVFPGFLGIETTVVLESGTQNLTEAPSIPWMCWLYPCLVSEHGSLRNVCFAWLTHYHTEIKWANTYRTCDQYWSHRTLFISLSHSSYPDCILTWRTLSLSFKVLQFSTRIPYCFVPWLILYTASYLNQAANSLKVRSTAATLSFVNNIPKMSKCKNACTHGFTAMRIMVSFVQKCFINLTIFPM